MGTARKRNSFSPQKRSRTAARAGRSPLKRRPAAVPPPPSEPPNHQWLFLTNHAHALALLSRNPSLVLREVALQVGITERAVQRIIADLEASGIIDREKIGRRNHYRIRAEQPLRHPLESHRTIADMLALLNGSER